MGRIFLGMNLEAIRRHEKPFEWGVEKAAELGYEYIEPMVHWGRELMSEAKYYHTVSMWDDPYRIRRAAEAAGLKVSGLQAHGPVCRPDAHGDYLKQAIRYAVECVDPVVNTDEGIKASWTTEEEDHVLMRYMLYEAALVAEPRGIKIGLECHSQYSKTPEGLDRIYNLVTLPAIGINLDTGNAFLAGQDVYAWLERVVERLVHLHATDIHVLRIGDAAVCTSRFELFNDYGVQIKARSKAVQTFVVQLAGDDTYLPTQRAVQGGGYSAVVQSNEVGPEGGQVLVERTVELINSIWAKPKEEGK